jgi:hypothetical protein
MSKKKQIYRNLVTGQKFIQTVDDVVIPRYEYIQTTPESVLTFNHGRNTDKLIIIVKDLDNKEIIPDRIQLENDRLNTFTIQFNQPVSCKVIVFFI